MFDFLVSIDEFVTEALLLQVRYPLSRLFLLMQGFEE